ncbi:MAG: hypothetical protein ACXWNZ_18170 [Vulcanimicrobiaceae bacterium]
MAQEARCGRDASHRIVNRQRKIGGSATGWIAAAWSYALAYYKAVWQALLLVLGAVPVFVPRRWLHRLIGGRSFGATAVAGGFPLAGMM